MILFYATRVGDGKQVKRFSLSTLLIMVLPSLYIIIAGITSNLPFSEQLNAHPQMINFAAVALGYGIPYTFLSGFELKRIEKEPSASQNDGTVDNMIADNPEKDTVKEADAETTDEAAGNIPVSESILDNFSDDTSDEES